MRELNIPKIVDNSLYCSGNFYNITDPYIAQFLIIPAVERIVGAAETDTSGIIFNVPTVDARDLHRHSYRLSDIGIVGRDRTLIVKRLDVFGRHVAAVRECKNAVTVLFVLVFISCSIERAYSIQSNNDNQQDKPYSPIERFAARLSALRADFCTVGQLCAAYFAAGQFGHKITSLFFGNAKQGKLWYCLKENITHMCSSVNKCIQRQRKDILHSNWGVAMSQNQLDSRLVGRVLARLRAEKGITQEVLSGLSDIGRTHLSALERGERKPTLETLYRISNALDMPMSAIVAEIEKEIRENS